MQNEVEIGNFFYNKFFLTESLMKVLKKINSQSLEDTQVGYISQKYSLDKYTLGRAFKPSYTVLSI